MYTNYYDVLIKSAQPRLYRLNAFRILELPVDSSTHDVNNRYQLIKSSTHVNLSIPNCMGHVLPISDSILLEDVSEAVQRLRDPENRLIDEFFWFWPQKSNKSDEDDALQALTEGDAISACKIWEIQENAAGQAHIALHNLAVFYHASALDMELEYANRKEAFTAKQLQLRNEYWVRSFTKWKLLLDLEDFWQQLDLRIHELDDPRLSDNLVSQIRKTLPLTLMLINAQLAFEAAKNKNEIETQRHLNLMNQSELKQDLPSEALRLTVEPIHIMIKSLCSNVESMTRTDPVHADQAIRQLYRQAWPSLNALSILLPESHRICINLHDTVAQQMLISAVTYGNITKNWDTGFTLFNLALSTALGKSTHARIESNINIAKSNIESINLRVIPVKQNIDSICSLADTNARENPAGADQITRQLYQQACTKLKLIDDFLPSENRARIDLHDNVVKQMLVNIIIYGDKTKNWDTVLDLYELALSITLSQDLQGKIKRNIAEVKNNIFNQNQTISTIREEIDRLCALADQESKSNPEHSDQSSRKLYQDVWPILDNLDNLLTKTNPIYINLHDNIAQQMQSNIILYTTKTKNWDAAFVLANLALTIAISQNMRTQLADYIKEIKDNIEHEQC